MQLGLLVEQKAVILMSRDFPLAEAKRIRSKWLARLHRQRSRGEVEAGCGVRKKRRLFSGYSPAEGPALGGQFGETRVLRRRGGVCTRSHR